MTCCNAVLVGSLTRDIAALGAYPHTWVPFLLRWEAADCTLATDGRRRGKPQPLVVLCQKEVPNIGTGFTSGFRTPRPALEKIRSDYS